MPHVIETALIDPKYPEMCPYCGKRNVETFFSRKFSKAKWVVPVPTAVFAGYKDYKIEYPSCNRCARFIKYSLWLSYILLTLPWVLFFYLILTDGISNAALGDISLLVALSCSGIALSLLSYRFFKVLRFRVGYIGEKSILYYSRSKMFSEQFAQLNDSQSVFRVLAFKLK